MIQLIACTESSVDAYGALSMTRSAVELCRCHQHTRKEKWEWRDRRRKRLQCHVFWCFIV